MAVAVLKTRTKGASSMVMLKRRCETCQTWLRSGFVCGRKVAIGAKLDVKALRKAGGRGVKVVVGVDGESGDCMKRGRIREDKRVIIENAVREREPMRPIWEKGSLFGAGGCEWR